MGIYLGNTYLYTLKFEDGQIIIANDKEDIEYMARQLQQEYRKRGLEINIQKTKYLPIGTDLSNIQLGNDDIITFCNKYTYLGVIFDSTGKCENEIRKRNTQARKTSGGESFGLKK